MANLGARNYLRVDAASDLPTMVAGDTCSLAFVLGETAGSYRLWYGATWQTFVGPTLSNPVTIGQGGHGTTGKTDGFDALSPTTTKGDLIVRGQTNNERLAAVDQQLTIGNSSASTGRRNIYNSTPVTLFAGGATRNYVTGASYSSVFSTGSSMPTRMKMNFESFRQARIISYGGILAIGGSNARLKIVDVTNTVDMTDAINFTSGTLSLMEGTWTGLSTSTFSGDATFEAQAQQGDAGGETIRLDNILLELR